MTNRLRLNIITIIFGIASLNSKKHNQTIRGWKLYEEFTGFLAFCFNWEDKINSVIENIKI